jgi:hypothetical protein
MGVVSPGVDVYATRELQVERLGDILENMVQSPRIEAMYEPVTIRCNQVISVVTGEPREDVEDSPVLVLGDSFLRIYERDEPGSAGFVSQLALELQLPLDSIIGDGGASTLVRQTLQRNPEKLNSKKLVIWEFVERDIRFGMTGWEIVRLPKPRGSATTTAQTPD